MEENRNISERQEEQVPKFRGLYRNVNISVRSLDYIIAACIAVILVVVALELRNPGFTIMFDSRGGTDVEAVSLMYGELLEEPETPSREGYVFTGWYTDSGCSDMWDMENDTIQSDMTLYAGWQKLQ
ncbi:MAG: InlB B-repeat-containing protein [Lachnospiraceae bacterium]|nr:InlB B-repeat-containing protein [Lachnospiraceae bacterium]